MSSPFNAELVNSSTADDLKPFTVPTLTGDATIERGASVAGHVPALDGLRTLAIAVVLAVHAGVPGSVAGWLGVDLFFALSGFLITTLLLDEKHRTGHLSVTRFWMRRFLRLMPAYYLYVTGISLAMWHWRGSVLLVEGGWTPREYTAALWLYFVNYAPMGGIWNGQGLTIHLWSLAVEEQYYLVWPLALSLLLKFPRVAVISSWTLAALALVDYFFWATNTDRAIALHARGLSLFFASAVAISASTRVVSEHVARFASGPANPLLNFSLLASIIAFVVQATGLLTEDQVRHFFLPGLAVLYAATIAKLWYGSLNGAWKLTLTNPLVVYIGKISYGLYLYHEAARIFVWWATDRIMLTAPRFLAYGVRLSLYLSLSVIVAAFSFQFYERPFLSLRRKFR